MAADTSLNERISLALQDIIEAINAVYEQEGVALPDRQYIGVGEQPHDCEQLTASFMQLYSGAPGDQVEAPANCDTPRSIVVQIQLVRCVPNKVTRAQSAPSVDQLNAVATLMTGDAMLLVDGAMASIPVAWLGGMADATVGAPSGGYQEVTVSLVTAIP